MSMISTLSLVFLFVLFIYPEILIVLLVLSVLYGITRINIKL